MEIIERFVVLMYDRACPLASVLYTKKNRTMERIPPTQNALEQRVKRAMLQSR